MREFQNNLTVLCKKYNSKRKLDFDDKEFLTLLMSYPSLLVAIADDHFDKKEQDLIISLAIGLLEEFKQANLTQQQISYYETKFLLEFVYLTDNQSEWKQIFLNFLLSFSDRELIEIRPAIKRMLIDVAEVSAGISQKEQYVIEFINSNYLS